MIAPTYNQSGEVQTVNVKSRLDNTAPSDKSKQRHQALNSVLDGLKARTPLLSAQATLSAWMGSVLSTLAASRIF